MAKKKVKSCTKCGDVVKNYSYGSYCSICAEKVWDAGFDSTSQHAEEQYESMLKKEKDVNELLNHPPVEYDMLRKLLGCTRGNFSCKKCRKLRLNWIWFKEENDVKLKAMLTTPCPKCKDTGNFTFK